MAVSVLNGTAGVAKGEVVCSCLTVYVVLGAGNSVEVR